MLQLALTFDQVDERPRTCEPNESGVLQGCEHFELAGEPRSARLGGGHQRLAEIDIGYFDGAWHWGVGLWGSGGGFGFMPAPKWKRGTDTRAEAIHAAVALLQKQAPRYLPSAKLRKLDNWLQQVLAGSISSRGNSND